MDQDDNRVLCRNGARELTEQETDHINGGLHTLTPCTIGPGSFTKRTEMRPLASAGCLKAITRSRTSLGNSFERVWGRFNGPN